MLVLFHTKDLNWSFDKSIHSLLLFVYKHTHFLASPSRFFFLLLVCLCSLFSFISIFIHIYIFLSFHILYNVADPCNISRTITAVSYRRNRTSNNTIIVAPAKLAYSATRVESSVQ